MSTANRPAGFTSLRMGGKTLKSLTLLKLHGLACPVPRRCFWSAADHFHRSYSRKGAGWSHRRDKRDAIHPVQDRGQRLLWCCLPDQTRPEWRRCRYQTCAPRQALQGVFLPSRLNSACCVLTIAQNRELQIMRIVRHPNIVELKAFYYSNGERVSGFWNDSYSERFLEHGPSHRIEADDIYCRRRRCISI